MTDFLDELNDIQRAAATAINGPVMVIAGPGSGKTRVLTYRIAYLIRTGVPAEQILTLTFTNKAAKEMKDRIGKVVGSAGQRVWAGTFHSIFARILRSEATLIGYSPNFTIYDTQDTQSLLSTIIKEMSLDPKVYSASAVRSRISMAKSNLVTAKAYTRDVQLLEEDKAAKRPHIHTIYEAYSERCKRAGAMDFDDLLLQTFNLFQSNPNEVLEKYRARFRYVLVDEFQDTNLLQYQIVRKLVKYADSPENLCIVGDDAQSIYAFRGATIDNILNFKKDYKHTQVFKLEQNYRSTHAIVQAANQVINYNKKQIQKKIWTSKLAGEPIRIIKAVSDTEEGKRIADYVLELKTRYHLQNKDIAILYRTNAQSRVFEEYLRRHNVPYKIFGGLSFYDRKEIKDFLAYMRLVVNNADDEAVRRIINYPRRGIGDTSLDKITAVANANAVSIWEVISHPAHYGIAGRFAAPLDEFVQLIHHLVERAQVLNAYDMAKYIADKAGILKELKADTSVEGISRLENLQELLNGISTFVNNDELDAVTTPDRSIVGYLQNIALISDLDSATGNENRVSLMTVHTAKGLEFKSVFVVGLEEELFPSFMAQRDADGIDEERRLFYVAITRAEQFLTLSYAQSRYRNGQVVYNPSSRFLNEIGNAEPERIANVGERPEGARTFSTSQLVGTRHNTPPTPSIDLSKYDFSKANAAAVQVNSIIVHERFGKGKVTSIEGGATNKVATIAFDEAGQKKIMLNYSKLLVIG